MRTFTFVRSLRPRSEFPARRSLVFTAIACLLATIAGAPARAQTLTTAEDPTAIVINPTTNKYYVGSSPLSVVDAAANKVTTVPGTTFGSAYVVNSVTNKLYYLQGITYPYIVEVDGATNAVSNVSLGGVSDGGAIAVNQVTNKIYVANSDTAGSVVVIDGATNAVTNVPVGNIPDVIAVNSVTNKIYVISAGAPTVSVIDGATNAVTNLTVPGANSAFSLAVNSTTNQIYVASNPVTVINGATNAVTTLASIPVGGAISTAGFAVNPVTNLLYVVLGSNQGNAATQPGSVMVINGFTGASSLITVGLGAHALAIDTATNTIAVANVLDSTLTYINGATNATSTVSVGTSPNAIAVNPVTNQFVVTDNVNGGSVTIVPGPAGTVVAPPAFTTSPQNQTTTAGQSVTFTGAASGSPTYQWLFNGGVIAGATNASLTINNVTAASAGTYTLVATNGGGSVSASAALALPVASAPSFTVQPSPQTVVSGTTVVFNSAAAGSPAPTFQWRLNGTNLTGATSARLVVTSAAATAGTYTCIATNSQGSVTSTGAALTLAATVNVGRLVNLSVNTTAGKSQVLTVGFVSGGSGTTGNENLLIRATGPALAALGVSNVLADPTLTVLSGSTVLVANDNWGTPTSNQTAVTAADSATFAFPLSNQASLDAAVAQPFAAGADTVQVSGNGAASGTALAEVYDNTPTASYTLATPRLINLSAKNQIVAGGSMTAGFVVGGSTAKTVLIRATGPALALLGVAGTIPDPQLTLHSTINNADTVLATNAGWGGDPQITAASNSVFAFPLTNAASADSVVLVTLAPGAYTAIASSVSGAAGTVLIEVYEVP